MSKIDDGGPAWPVPPQRLVDGTVIYGHLGLTKREAFAMAAMQGLAPRWGNLSGNEIAKASVMIADALLAALRGDA